MLCAAATHCAIPAGRLLGSISSTRKLYQQGKKKAKPFRCTLEKKGNGLTWLPAVNRAEYQTRSGDEGDTPEDAIVKEFMLRDMQWLASQDDLHKGLNSRIQELKRDDVQEFAALFEELAAEIRDLKITDVSALLASIAARVRELDQHADTLNEQAEELHTQMQEVYQQVQYLHQLSKRLLNFLRFLVVVLMSAVLLKSFC